MAKAEFVNPTDRKITEKEYFNKTEYFVIGKFLFKIIFSLLVCTFILTEVITHCMSSGKSNLEIGGVHGTQHYCCDSCNEQVFTG